MTGLRGQVAGYLALRRAMGFKMDKHGPLSSSAVGNVVVRACCRAGLEPASAHQLRHVAATAMRRAGAPLSEISQLLRHQHEGTTARYGTIDPDELGPVTAPWPGEAA